MSFLRFFAFTIISFLFSTSSANGKSFNLIEPDSIDKIGLTFFNKAIEVSVKDLDSSFIYVERALPYFEKAKNWEYFVDCYNLFFGISFYKRDYSKAKEHLQNAFENSKKILKKSSSTYARTLNNVAYQNLQIGDLGNAEKYYFEALEIERKNSNQNKDLLGTLLLNIGNLYSKKGEFDKSNKYFFLAIDSLQHSQDIETALINILYAKIGLIQNYKNQNQFQKSVEIIKTIINDQQYKDKSGNDILNSSISRVYELYGEINYEIGNNDLVPLAFKKAIKLQEGYASKRKYITLKKLGDIKKKQGKIVEALHVYKESNNEILKLFNFTSSQLIENFFDLAHTFFLLKDFSSAKSYYEKSILGLSSSSSHSIDFEDINSKNIFKSPLNLKILSSYAALHHTQYHHENQKDINLLKQSLKLYQLTAEVIQQLRSEYLTYESKNFLSQNTLEVFDKAIQVAYELYQLTGEKEYYDAAFQFCERNKAFNLLEALSEDMAKGIGNIPDSLLEQERDLKIEIAFFEKTINEEKQKGESGDVDLIKQWENDLFDLENDYRELTESFEENYPKYYELKFNTKLTSVEEAQKEILKEGEALVEYFVGADKIYQFLITKDGYHIKPLEYEESLFEEMNQLLDLLKNPPDGSKAKADFEQFTGITSNLYNLLIGSVKDQLPADLKRLYLIPDDALAFLPFEILLTERPVEGAKVNYSPDALNYLFEEQQLVYGYSSTLLQNNLRSRETKVDGQFLGIAPTFGDKIAEAQRDCSSDELYSLMCNQKEIENILGLLNGKMVGGTQANKAQFLNESTHYRILHLATHACVDDQNPDFNKIWLADDYVSNLDLYNMDFNADLAVLSACNTASGKLVKGEGVQSLAKGFLHAGCPSLLTSLWSVDDCATSDIMVHFYKNLKEGLTKDQALQQAKIDYLSTADKLRQHPYYWAAFVQIGNPEAMELSSGGIAWWMWLLGVIVIIFVARALARKRSSRL